MRIADIITESVDPKSAVLDLLTVLSSEGIDSISISALQDEMNKQEIDVDHNSLFDLLDNVAIVRNIKDDIVYFSTDSDRSSYTNTEADPEKQQKTVSKLARKQVKKELDL